MGFCFDFRFANVGFDINSPDSNDSGIQSDARSDDGISNTQVSVSENLSSFVNKSYQGEYAGEDGEHDSDENTPTQVCLYYQCLEDSSIITNEPAHQIMALSVLRKLILIMHMRSHPVGLDV